MNLPNGKITPRLLIILNRFVIGGQAVDTLPLAWHLQTDLDILIVYGDKEKDELEPFYLLQKYPGLKLKKVKYLKRVVNPFIDIAAFFQVLLIILKYKPHIVHTHGAKSGLIGRCAAFLARVPVIIHTFHGHLFHSYFSDHITRLVIYIERFIGKLTTGFVALSDLQFNDLVVKFKILPAEKIRVIPLGISNETGIECDLLRKDFRKRYQLQEHDVAIGIVGRIVPVKNHNYFADIAAAILKKCGDLKPAFFVIGDGDLKEPLQQYLKKLNVSFSEQYISTTTRVVFTSWLTNIPEVMSGLDIVVLTSLNEGTPLSILEAQAFGKPVVSTNVGGVKDTLINNVTGFCINAGDKTGFEHKLCELIANPLKRTIMGAAGQEFVKENFSKQKEINMTKEFYFSLLKLKK